MQADRSLITLSDLVRRAVAIVDPPGEDPAVEEFALAVSQCSRAEPDGTLLPSAAHRIVVCTGGEVELVNGSDQRLKLARGESVYAGPDDGDLRVLGTGEVAQAYTPGSDRPVDTLVDLLPPYAERSIRRGRPGPDA